MHFTHKNIALIILSVLIIGGAFVFAEFKNKKTEKVVYSSPVVATEDAITSELQERDTDSDGLRDWEEVLAGTDSRNKDTDGDGTSDGKEVSLGRDPLVKGADDRTITTRGAATKDLTPREKMARDFFARYMELEQAGLGDDEDSKLAMVTEVIKNGVVIETPKKFSMSDVRIIDDSSEDSLRLYGNLVGNILKNNPHPTRDEIVILNESLTKENPEILKEIDPIIAMYKNVFNSLLKVRTPEVVAQLHLDLLNSVNAFIFVAESLRKSDVDTMKGIQGVSLYTAAGESLFNSLHGIALILEKSKIEFSPTEGGSIFNKP